MSPSSSYETGLYRSNSTVSIAASATTYHSLREVELGSSKPSHTRAEPDSPSWREDIFQPMPMQRQDSGYESIPAAPKSSNGRRTSTVSNNSSHSRPRTRPSIRRSAKSTPSPRSSIPSNYTHSRPRSQHKSNAYFHFPSLEGSVADDDDDDDDDAEAHELQPAPHHPPPPRTTHYWTSDHTRKLEYAAIDAASRGVRGWILRHVVPDCFVPKQNRRLGFDDDTGSVRRYRLELELDDETEKRGAKGKKMGWLMGSP